MFFLYFLFYFFTSVLPVRFFVSPMFKGKIILVQGTNDNVVPIEEAREVITNNENLAFIRKLIILKDVDHQFKYINDRKSKKINKIILDILINES